MNSPKVSVCVPTFQHEKFIAQMLDSVIMQQTSFDYEIVIGDDGSTDQTPAIIQRYIERHPRLFQAYLHKENQGPAEPREFAGRNNVLQLLKACRGEYVALCEGDDYWTDPLKLQKQVDFLDANPDFSICHHNVRVIYEDGSPEHLFNSEQQKSVSGIEDILMDNWFMATASWLYRNHFLTTDFAEWHHKAASGDWAVIIQIAKHGKIQYLPEVMGVYRKHRGGLSNVHAPTNLFYLTNRMEMFQNIGQWLNDEYDEIIQKTVSSYQNEINRLQHHL
jgi:glycosyltransferase involved in cell wall biosynthesis